MKGYGIELILDLHNCNEEMFNRESIQQFFKLLCDKIDMQPEDLFWWDDEGVPEDMKQILPHTKGTSAVQFILTSSIVIHTLDMLKKVYLNIFSCKEFDPKEAKEFAAYWFGGEVAKQHLIERL